MQDQERQKIDGSRRWPVVLVEYGDLFEQRRGPKPSGSEIGAACFYVTDENGERSVGGYVIECPLCGSLGGTPLAGLATTEPGRGWTAEVTNGRLTMNPSIVCGEACGGHYWLNDGILQEV